MNTLVKRIPVIIYAPYVVFFLGAGTVLLSRALAYFYQQQLFIDTSPSISKIASFMPGLLLFKVGISIVCVAIVISWLLCYQQLQQRLQQLPENAPSLDRESKALFIAILCGSIAGLFLLLLTHNTLEDNDPFHIFLSFGFFISQVLAFIIDVIILNQINRKLAQPLFNTQKIQRLTLFIFAVALFFLFLYFTKDHVSEDYRLLVRRIFVLCEYTIACCSFLYSALRFYSV